MASMPDRGIGLLDDLRGGGEIGGIGELNEREASLVKLSTDLEERRPGSLRFEELWGVVGLVVGREVVREVARDAGRDVVGLSWSVGGDATGVSGGNGSDCI